METHESTQYGFVGCYKEQFPSQIIIDATDVCNLACIHCPHTEFKKSPHYRGCFLDAALSNKAVDEVREHGAGITLHIRFTGAGEPLLHKSIYSMLAYAVSQTSASVSLTTNGTLMNQGSVEKLLESRVHLVDISIDAYRPETYANIRVNGDLQRTVANVLNLIRLSRLNGSGTKIAVSYIEQPLNVDETADFDKFWKDHGVDFVVIRRLHSAAGAVGGAAEVMRSTNRDQNRRPCPYPWERIVLSASGLLLFCPADWTHGSNLGDYRLTTIKEVWQGEAYEKLRAAHLNNDYADQDFCGQCPDWSAVRWPSEGRSYLSMVEDLKAGAGNE